jgi:hypothetical protein
MKNRLKFAGLILFAATSFVACKGGASAQKQDSTMLDTNARDSAAKLSHDAHQPDTEKIDSAKKDTTKKM